MSASIQLADLLKDLPLFSRPSSCLIEAITQDSRSIKPGTLFLAIPGLRQDGRVYIAKALAQGASAVLYDNSDGFQPGKDIQSMGKPLLGVPQLSHHLGLIASRFYQNPSQKMTLIGVTGTNGKSSITHFIAQALNRQRKDCAVVGTLGKGFPPQLQATGYTTPDAISLQRDIAQFLSEGAKSVAMEVSSHSLAQQRVAGIQFDIAVFTNLTRDHLDYHSTMAEYGAAKARLFQFPELKHCIYNADDPFGLELLAKHPSGAQAWVYSTNPHLKINFPAVIAKEIHSTSNGFRIQVRTPKGEAEWNSSLLGRFNISNTLAVLCVLEALDFSLVDSMSILKTLQPVAGRMQSFGGFSGKPLVIVDYAHTPDALKQVLTSLREHRPRKLWCVFGCGGDRDKGKRAQMGAISAEFADSSVVTSDNPRNENPEDIIQEIKSGMTSHHSVHIEPDRAAAIAYALHNASSNDIVLIAGKGHETEQIIGKTSLPFSDALVVQNILFP
jgi:UDP-N-acetylmuramoyl-L-alanyl-D-glutamate--2,6-diaminopimelate ligase